MDEESRMRLSVLEGKIDKIMGKLGLLEPEIGVDDVLIEDDLGIVQIIKKK